MINKPVSCIMNLKEKMLYNITDVTLDGFINDSNANDGSICFIDSITKKTFNPIGDNFSYHTQGIKIYQKYDGGKVLIRNIGQKPLKSQDLHNVTYTGYKAGSDQTITITPSEDCITCDKEFGLRFEVKNDELYQQQFKNMYTESYIVPADKCCEDESPMSAAEICLLLYKAWKENENNSMLTAELDDPNTPTKIRFTVSQSKLNTYGQMNFKYLKNRLTTMKVTYLGAFECCTPVEENVPAVAPQTMQYDLKQMEFDFMGWMNESPYRLSDVTLSEMGKTYRFNEIDDSTLYDVLVINYEQWSDAPWGHWQHPEQLVIATENTKKIDSTNTLNALAAFFGLTVANETDTATIDFK